MSEAFSGISPLAIPYIIGMYTFGAGGLVGITLKRPRWGIALGVIGVFMMIISQVILMFG